MQAASECLNPLSGVIHHALSGSPSSSECFKSTRRAPLGSQPEHSHNIRQNKSFVPHNHGELSLLVKKPSLLQDHLIASR